MNRAAPQPAARARFWSFVIPWDAGTLAPNRVTHRMQRYRLAMHARRAAAFVWIQRGRPRAQSRVRVDITIRRTRALDEDNAIASLKPLLDGLFNVALTPDDSPKWVSLGAILQHIDPQWKYREEVQFDVTEVDA